MPGRCAVPLCDSNVGGFTFPTNLKLKKKWIQALRRTTREGKKWTPSKHDIVCYKHFLDEDFRPLKPFAKGHRRLIKDVVPSIFSFKKAISESGKARIARAKMRREKVPEEDVAHEKKCIISDDLQAYRLSVAANETVPFEEMSDFNDDEYEASSTREVGTGCNLLASTPFYRIERFVEDNEAFQYLTGFDSYGHFMLLFNILGPSCYDLHYKSMELDPENELFLTLIKLRQAKDYTQLGIDFGISRPVASKIVKVWINFMYFELSELDFWPSRTTIDEHFPSGFQSMFPATRVILDATEVPIERPSNCNAQRITFSSYKNCNTLKTMVGISPRGVVSYLSDSYGGSTSDRQIIERSTILNGDLLSSGDSIMADRGIMVQDLFAHKDIQVNTPTTMKGRNQHDPKTVIRDRRIASKRIHVERAIGFAKTFKILQKPLESEKILMGGRILKVCFLLTNFRNSIVSKRA